MKIITEYADCNLTHEIDEPIILTLNNVEMVTITKECVTIHKPDPFKDKDKGFPLMSIV